MHEYMEWKFFFYYPSSEYVTWKASRIASNRTTIGDQVRGSEHDFDIEKVGYVHPSYCLHSRKR